jgi:STAS-like domain of unknown function (DUF4325)
MKSINLEAEFGQYLSSRPTGARLRMQIESSVKAGQVVSIDLTNVESMSESFADEALALLVVEFGSEWFKKSIRLEGAKPHVRDSILNAILERRMRMVNAS